MAEESRAVRVAREYREQLARNEDEALRRMARYWVKMENELEPQFIALAQQVKELRDQGRSVPPQYIYNLNRYQQMMADIMKEIPEYESQAVSLITHYQEENFILGLDSASAVIRASKPSDAIWNKVGKDAAETMAGFAGNGAPLAELLQRDYGDIGAKITDALVSGIGLGKGAFAVAKDMRDAMGMEYNRSVRIARTEINRAYRIANADQYAASGVVERVIRLCYKPTACLACLMMDGEECKNGIVDDHPNGKCTSIAVTIGGNYPRWEKGSEWLETLPENDQRRIMGDGRYEMWKKDGIDPRKMVTMKPNDIWGGSPSVISEKELRNLYNLTSGNKTLFDFKPVAEKTGFVPVTTVEEAKTQLQTMFKSVENSFMSNDADLIISNTNQLLKLNEKYGAVTDNNRGYITASRSGNAIGWTASSYKRDLEDTDLSLVGTFFKKPELLKKEFEKSRSDFFNMPSAPSDWNIYTVTHEYGHILQNFIARRREDWDAIDAKVSKTTQFKKIREIYRNAEKKQAKTMYEEIIEIAKNDNPDFKLSENLSRYGHTNYYEAFAEMFANSQLGTPNELGRAMSKWLEKEGF